MNSALASGPSHSTLSGIDMHHFFSRASSAMSRLSVLIGSAVLLSGLVPAQAQAQTAPAGYYLACQEKTVCVIGPYSKDVAFGTGNNLTKRVGMTGAFDCSTDTFGDPAKKQTKYCFISVQESRRQAIAVGGTYVNVNPKQKVWYGVDGRFNDKEVSGNVLCDNKTFGEPAKGRHKGCFIFQPW